MPEFHPTSKNSEFLTTSEVAAVLKISRYTVVRKFADLPGVVNLGHPSQLHCRRYRQLRIPRQTLEHFLRQREAR